MFLYYPTTAARFDPKMISRLFLTDIAIRLVEIIFFFPQLPFSLKREKKKKISNDDNVTCVMNKHDAYIWRRWS